MRTSNGFASFESPPDDCGGMPVGESQTPATQADLKFHHINLQRLLSQFKSEILSEQKQQLEQSFEFMMFNVSGSGSNATLPEVPGGTIPLQTAISPRTPTNFDLKRSASQMKRHLWEGNEERDDYVPRTSNLTMATSSTSTSVDDSTQGEDASPQQGALRPSSASQSSRKSARFVADKITKRVHVETRKSDENDTHSPKHNDHPQSSHRCTQIADSCAKKIKSPTFDAICGLIICFNAILVGVETECLAQHGKIPDSVDNLQFALNMWYSAELLLRVYAHKCNFFVGDDRNWNIFDTCLVASAMVDLALANMSFLQNLKTARMLRVVRLFRIVRTLRIIRSFKYVREFRKMVYSLMSSIQTLFWSLLLVFAVMYSFALWFTQALAWYKEDHEDTQDAKVMANLRALNMYYSSFTRTIYTLFAAISGGYSWSIVVDPWISSGGWLSSLLFFVFISIAVFGLMNIVTSVFVESAMHATQHFQDLLVDAKIKDLEMYTYHMERIFREIDTDAGGTISFSEMKKFLHDSASELPQYLEALGISSADVWVLFRLLDKDGSGCIDISEFCDGCMRLKGEAKSFDINCMIYESRAMIHSHAHFMEFVEERFEHLTVQLEQKTLDLGKRVSMGHCAIMSRLDKTDRRPSNRASGTMEARLNQARSEPQTPLTETIGSVSPPNDPAEDFRTPGVGIRKGVSHRMRFLYATPGQAATNQPNSFTATLPLDEN